jgi:hypothetical protein
MYVEVVLENVLDASIDKLRLHTEQVASASHLSLCKVDREHAHLVCMQATR